MSNSLPAGENQDASILTLLGDLKARLEAEGRKALENGSFVERRRIETRLSFVRTLYETFSLKLGPYADKRVFVSFTQRTAEVHLGYVRKELQAKGFEVVTGFERIEGDQEDKLKRIIGQIKRSPYYIGLLTKDHRYRGSGDEDSWAPGVWTVVELGMALALDKTIYLMVEDGVHADFFVRILGQRIHYIFNQTSFFGKADEVVSNLNASYYQGQLA